MSKLLLWLVNIVIVIWAVFRMARGDTGVILLLDWLVLTVNALSVFFGVLYYLARLKNERR